MLTACGIETGCDIIIGKDDEIVVATVLTACGIETGTSSIILSEYRRLQQCLPLAVLKPARQAFPGQFKIVATVLTACGIETPMEVEMIHGYGVATVLTACGIET